ncbi:winged helix-turn-helix domain-containing protein [Methanolobus sediminis]|uniref:Winged helix-turn-helix domain-containing protein n=1 Tax=Methanolobus sediminis TaxID=3072978 RepID=A0AA51YIY0_9EURY|nr:winged helix-turn-helix domain-containing protein [Methanolobus sediminis]WMW25016.1 winged helix-turn-helix domain-containing protein [Methanolobus sediminis]
MVTKDKRKINEEIQSKILEVLSIKDMHLAEISKGLNISSACVSKHVRILEDANLVERNILGRSHVISLINKHESKESDNKNLSELELYIIERRFLV